MPRLRSVKPTDMLPVEDRMVPFVAGGARYWASPQSGIVSAILGYDDGSGSFRVTKPDRPGGSMVCMEKRTTYTGLGYGWGREQHGITFPYLVDLLRRKRAGLPGRNLRRLACPG